MIKISKKLLLYKKCAKCGNHSYLTEGGYYLCTHCNNKEYVKTKNTTEVSLCL